MPICTAVLTAALFTGPASLPPDPAPSVTKAPAGRTGPGPSADTQQAIYPQLVTMPALSGSAAPAQVAPPPGSPWSSLAAAGKAGKDGEADAAEKAATADAAEAAGKAAAKPAVQSAVQTAAEQVAQPDGGDTEKEETAKIADDGVPMIDPKTHDLVIRPVMAPAKPGEMPKPFILHPVKGVQMVKAYPAYGHTRRQPVQHPGRHLGARGGR